jgi:hypothetical protein
VVPNVANLVGLVYNRKKSSFVFANTGISQTKVHNYRYIVVVFLGGNMKAKRLPIAFFSAVALASSLALATNKPTAACMFQKGGGLVTSQNSSTSLDTPFSNVDPKTWGIASASIVALGGFIAAGVSYQKKMQNSTASEALALDSSNERELEYPTTIAETTSTSAEGSQREPVATR